MRNLLCTILGHNWKSDFYDTSYSIHYKQRERDYSVDYISRPGMECQRCGLLLVPELTLIVSKIEEMEYDDLVATTMQVHKKEK